SEALFHAKEVWFRLFLFSFIFLILIIFSSIFFSSSMTSSLRKLIKAIRAVSHGSLDFPIEIKTQDEIGQVSQEFKDMTELIKTLYGGLEKKVQSRTNELSKKIEEIERMNELMVGRELKMIELKKEIANLKEKLGKE
ncbi:HAMP domain-containing protein, partial [Patescibacteria group bacterium]|nr:HAMP domain-containing protein [Patescibacteria group bacterium]